MARYFFNVHDGMSGLDEDGVDLPNLTVARAEGLSLAGQIIREAAATGSISEDWHLDVKDSTGLTLFRMDFNVSETAATAGRKLSSCSGIPSFYEIATSL